MTASWRSRRTALLTINGAGAEAMCCEPPAPADLAGRLGVAFADALTQRDHIALSDEGGVITPAGEEFLLGPGIDVRDRSRYRRAFCRPCLDWSERRPHLAGAVGAALAARCFEPGWIARIHDTRAVCVTDKGGRGLSETFEIELAA